MRGGEVFQKVSANPKDKCLWEKIKSSANFLLFIQQAEQTTRAGAQAFIFNSNIMLII